MKVITDMYLNEELVTSMRDNVSQFEDFYSVIISDVSGDQNTKHLQYIASIISPPTEQNYSVIRGPFIEQKVDCH